VALILVLSLILCSVALSSAAERSIAGLNTLEEIISNIETYHLSNPGSDTLINGAINGMIESLNDPHTMYLTPEQLNNFESALDGIYIGVGMKLQAGEKYPVVSDTIEKSPARAAGIKPGDMVIKVDGFDTSKDLLEKVVQRISGPEGTTVRLTISSEGLGEYNIQLVRTKITIYMVSGEIMEDNIGYIKLSSFGSNAPDEFRKILGSLILQGADKLILDLRDNPGGMLDVALQICGNFIEPCEITVSVVDRDGNKTDYCSVGKPIAANMPIAVLVNGNSASAAEILASALQDYNLAVVIGRKTYGKGTVQNVIHLESGGVLMITTARYYTPKGRTIDGIGLYPDIQVTDPELILDEAKRYLKTQFIKPVTLNRQKLITVTSP
jgi:carboxyl-terminal processing protease